MKTAMVENWHAKRSPTQTSCSQTSRSTLCGTPSIGSSCYPVRDSGEETLRISFVNVYVSISYKNESMIAYDGCELRNDEYVIEVKHEIKN